MLKTIEGVKYNYNYNCFESDKSILDNIAKLYKVVKEIKGSNYFEPDFDFIKKTLEFLGYEILFYLGREEYEGNAYIIFSRIGTAFYPYYLYQTSYGSCTVCDIWQKSNFLTNLYEEANDAIEFPNVFEMIKYLLGKDWFDNSIKDFSKKEAIRTIEWANGHYSHKKEIMEQVQQIQLLLNETEREKNND